MAVTPKPTPSASPEPKSEQAGAPAADVEAKNKTRRNIPGDFLYTSTPGKFKVALDNILKAERPEIVNKDYISSYLGVSGGSASPIPPLLKRIGFISNEGKPTDLYAKFQSDAGRAGAALEGLRKGFPELFKKNTYVHSLNEDQVKDVLVEITGLKKTDPIISSIYGTFDAIRSFVPPKFIPKADSDGDAGNVQDAGGDDRGRDELPIGRLGLSYHINIVLPETKDIQVFNAIFQSLKQNLL